VKAQDAVERALAAGSTDASIVVVAEHRQANIRWANNTLTTNGTARTRDVTVVSIAGRSVGVVARSDVTDETLPELVQQADREAKDAVPAEDAAPLVADVPASPDWDAGAGEVAVGDFGGLIADLADVSREAAAADLVLYGYGEQDVTTVYLGTSTGIRLRDELPATRLELTGRSTDGTRSSWAGQAGRGMTDVNLRDIAGQVRRRLDWAQRRLELPAGRYECVLPASAIADLMADLYWSAGALDAAEGRSVFSGVGGSTRLGDRLATLPVSLYSDPTLAPISCTPFVVATASSRLSSVFDNGLPLGRTDWIRDGQLTALLGTRHSADVTGVPLTPYIDNLVLESASPGHDVEEMVRQTRRGLLLTCLWYIREVDPKTLLLTGLTRDGVFLVEDGEVVGAVNNFRFNESPVDLLGRIVEVGPSRPAVGREVADYLGRTVMPPVRVPDFNMSTVSQAS
jgi:predicted Zn-dependent protease